jgi:glycerophosphoryl diester phosphodiesterase
MATKAEGDEKSLQAGGSVYRRIGHKGADSIVQGNTVESFEAAVEHGVDMVELDVLRGREGRLVVAHDYEDVSRRRALDLTEALDAFKYPPLDKVEIDCDLKLPGREAELAGALAGQGLIERAMVSTMEIESLRKLRHFEPDLRLGWTYPKTRRDWTQYGWARPGIVAGLAALRRRFPKLLVEQVPELDIDAVWAYHHLVTPDLLDAAEQVGVELVAWTVDDLERMAELIGMGVHAICSNDPRLFEQAEKRAASGPPEPVEEPKPSRKERKAEKKEAKTERKAEKKAGKAEKKAAKKAPKG